MLCAGYQLSTSCETQSMTIIMLYVAEAGHVKRGVQCSARSLIHYMLIACRLLDAGIITYRLTYYSQLLLLPSLVVRLTTCRCQLYYYIYTKLRPTSTKVLLGFAFITLRAS